MTALASIKVVLVDDHALVRGGVALFFKNAPGISLVGQASNAEEAMSLVQSVDPDVVVMDITLPGMNGIEATRLMRARFPRVKVLGLSMHNDKRYVRNMLQAGAAGYVHKVAAPEELARAVEIVARGERYLSPALDPAVADPDECPSAYRTLGRREREVLTLVAEGKKSRAIAAQLGITVKTVEAHRRNIMKKLGIYTVAGLTKFAVCEGLTSLES
jgi:DNA-binding NarL/FixJ family response regulator